MSTGVRLDALTDDAVRSVLETVLPSRLTGDLPDVTAADSEVGQLPVGEALEFTHCFPILEPGADFVENEGDDHCL